MTVYSCNTSFDWSGRQFRVGDLVEDDSAVYALFPSRFSLPTGGPLRVANSATASTLGTVVKKVQVFDASGTSLGYIPVYDAIT